MSETKKKQLADTLIALDIEERAWVMNFLVQLFLGQAQQERARKARVIGRHHEGFTEKQWEEYFADTPEHEFPTETPPLDREFLHATSGKTIEPLRKWL
ncbi:MAG: hypothetical protein IKQ59_13430 [Prevotella sp.]|jgi:hypothetical protein|nr:hypothetical protein [Prevotella sp.]